MPEGIAVTHADVEPSHGRTDLSSKTGLVFMVITILLGITCFVLSLMAEAARSEEYWMKEGEGGKSSSECVYSGNGKVPLICGAGAFVGLEMAMVVMHAYMLIAASKSAPDLLLSWDSASAKSLTWQAGFFFVSTWISFGVGEIVLLTGVCIESGYVSEWWKPKERCVKVRERMLSGAGVMGLITVFLASALCLSLVRIQTISQRRHNVLEASALYASSSTSAHPQQPPHINLTQLASTPHPHEFESIQITCNIHDL